MRHLAVVGPPRVDNLSSVRARPSKQACACATTTTAFSERWRTGKSSHHLLNILPQVTVPLVTRRSFSQNECAEALGLLHHSFDHEPEGTKE